MKVLIKTLATLVECEETVHRDIKPSNILIDQNNKLKFGDFGTAKKFKL